MENMPRVCLVLMSFFGVVHYSSYWPQKLTVAAEIEFQNRFWRNANINRKLQNFDTKRFNISQIYVFWPSFVEISKAEVTKPILGICHEKKPFDPFLRCPWSNLAKNVIMSLFSHPIFLPSFVQTHPVSREVYEKCFQTNYNIGVKPVGYILADKNRSAMVHLKVASVYKRSLPYLTKPFNLHETKCGENGECQLCWRAVNAEPSVTQRPPPTSTVLTTLQSTRLLTDL